MKNKNLRIATILILFTILFAGIAQARPWYSGAFYIVRDATGDPLLSYVKGNTVTLSLENEMDNYQTIYTQYVGQIKNVNTGKIVKPYKKLSKKVAIKFGGTYGTKWTINVPPGKYQSCAIVTNSKNNKKELCAQPIRVFSKPTAELTVVTFGKSYTVGQSVPFGITGSGTLPIYLDTLHYIVTNVDTGTSFPLDVVGYLLEKMDGGYSTYSGFDWDQKISGAQVLPGRYKIRWYYGLSPSPAPKNKYANSAIFTIK